VIGRVGIVALCLYFLWRK